MRDEAKPRFLPLRLATRDPRVAGGSGYMPRTALTPSSSASGLNGLLM